MNQIPSQLNESNNSWSPLEIKKLAKQLQSTMSLETAIATISTFREMIVVEDMPRLVESYQRTLPRALNGVNVQFINSISQLENVFVQIAQPTLILTDNKILEGTVSEFLKKRINQINPDNQVMLSISSDHDFPFEQLIEEGLFLPRNFPQEAKLISDRNLIDIAASLRAKQNLS